MCCVCLLGACSVAVCVQAKWFLSTQSCDKSLDPFVALRSQDCFCQRRHADNDSLYIETFITSGPACQVLSTCTLTRFLLHSNAWCCLVLSTLCIPVYTIQCQHKHKLIIKVMLMLSCPVLCNVASCCAMLLLCYACCGNAGKQRAEHKVREADSAETVTQQWLALMALLRDSNSSVLYHMENHYCLIFAGRSWHMDAGTPTVHF